MIPDSNWPTSFDAPMKTILTELTRPRMASGVPSCTTVWRMMTLTISHAPSSMRTTSDTTRLRDSPKAMVHSPKPKTQASIVLPALR